MINSMKLFPLLAIMIAAAPMTPVFAQNNSIIHKQAAELALQNTRLEAEIRKLYGTVEQLEFQMRQLHDLVNRMQKDYEFRLQELEFGTTNKTSPSVSSKDNNHQHTNTIPQRSRDSSNTHDVTPQILGNSQDRDPISDTISASKKSSEAPIVLQPKDHYSSSTAKPSIDSDKDSSVAVRLFAKAKDYRLNDNFDLAESAFEEFIAHYPKHHLTPEAQYWLAETFYVRGHYRKAVNAFKISYDQYGSGPKALESLYRLAFSYKQIGEMQASCKRFNEFIAKYPNAPKELRQSAILEQKNCSQYLQ